MNIRRGAFALPILFILLAVSSVTIFAQSDRQTVNVPFDFIVADKAMPAGQYILERNKRDNDTVWTITSKDTGASRKVFLTSPNQSLDPAAKTKLVFHRYETYNFLTSFTVAGSNTGRELLMSDRERNLGEKLLAQRETIILTSGRGR